MFRYRIDDELELRIYEERHAQEVFDAVVASREHLRAWLPWANDVQRLDDTITFIRRSLEQFARNDGMQAGIWETGKYVGGIGMHFIRQKSSRTEIGYWLAAGAQGRGIMTRACRAMTDFCIDELKLNRIEIQCATENKRSRGVPERLGFTEEGILRQAGKLEGGFVDHVVYAMLAEDWRQITARVRTPTARG
jgi:ribosomal-protein-serine acetyltransferase